MKKEASTSFSPLAWECPNCRQGYHSQSNNNVTFLRGTCQHDVCSNCIAQNIIVASRRYGDNVNAFYVEEDLVETKCPIDRCKWGWFCMKWGEAKSIESRGDDAGRDEFVEELTHAGGNNAKRGQNKKDAIDLCDEDSYHDDVNKNDSRFNAPPLVVSVKTESEKSPKPPPRIVSIKKEKKKPTREKKGKAKNHTAKPPGNTSTTPTAATNRTISPLPTKEQSNLKPIFKKGDEVYAAWWDPIHDKKRKGQPSWYPGKIKSFSEIGRGQYGSIRLYNINFDDGDTIDILNDCWVFPKNDYLLTTHFLKMGWEHIGVQQVFDNKSSDRWAKTVGWYEVVINGQTHSFSLLSNAMKAHDAHVVHVNGPRTKKSYLNLPDDYPWLFGKSAKSIWDVKHELKEEVKHELKEEVKLEMKAETDDDSSRFSEVSIEPLDNKRRRLDNPPTTDFWATVADPVDFSQNAFMTKPLFHLNPGIHRKIQQNRWFGPFLREGIATPGFAPVPPQIAQNVPTWSYMRIRDAYNEISREDVRDPCQVAMWLKDATVGSFIVMRHEFRKCPFCPARLKDNGKYIGPVYVIGVITKKILPGSAEERDIRDNRMGEFRHSNTHTFSLVQWRWMGMKSKLEETTKKYINAVCQPTINRMCQDPSKVYKSGATGESVRLNLWENATIPIDSADFPDVFDVDP